MRTFSALGWFALEMIGALELDRTTHPVMQAWALDAVEPFEGGRAGGMTDRVTVDHKRGVMTIHAEPGRVSGKRAALRKAMADDDRAMLVESNAPSAPTVECPQCNKTVPKAEIDGSYPYGCCIACYWELGD